MNEELRVGRHYLRYEPPDILFVKFTGEIAGPDVREIIAVCTTWLAGKKYLLILADMSDVGGASADARNAGTTKLNYEMRGVAFFGASSRMRIIANLVSSATNLLLKRLDNPVRFFATEEQGRAWLLERRRKILADRR